MYIYIYTGSGGVDISSHILLAHIRPRSDTHIYIYYLHIYTHVYVYTHIQAVVVLKFHPMCYLHIYIFGVALAVIYVRFHRPGVRVPWVAENGAIIGSIYI